MKQAHFLEMLFHKNRKGKLRSISIAAPVTKHEWQSGGMRTPSPEKKVINCEHCKAPVAMVKADIFPVSGTCSACITRERLVRISA